MKKIDSNFKTVGHIDKRFLFFLSFHTVWGYVSTHIYYETFTFSQSSRLPGLMG